MVNGVDIFKEFLALAKTIATTATVTAAFIDDAGTLPQVVVSYPQLPRKRYTYGTTRYKKDGSIDIEIIATTSRVMKTISEEIQDVMFSGYKASTSVKDLEVNPSDSFRTQLGDKSAPTIVLTFDFKCRD